MRALIATILALLAIPAQAEVTQVKALTSFGISFLPVMVVQEHKLIEKHAKAAGLDVEVSWSTGGTGNAATDALLSGSVDFATTGATALITLWSKTHGGVKAMCAFSTMPFTLNTRNPEIRSLKDYTDKSRIVVPGVLVSPQAVLLQMAAEKELGNLTALDKLTVTMTHPEGMAAMLSGKTEIDSHFTTPPFNYLELKEKGVRQLLSSEEILGGPATFNLVFATQKFHDQNPKVFGAYLAALGEATRYVTENKREAAGIYLKIMNDRKTPLADILEIMEKPEISFSTTPQGIYPLAEFMQRTGRIPEKPASWKGLFFAEIHDLPGS